MRNTAEILQVQLGSRWESALNYFRERRAVIFISYCRFWDRHSFVQQSLAQALVAGGVKVIWLDGSGWRPYSPTVDKKSPLLDVHQSFRLPGERIPFIKAANRSLQAARLNALIRENGNPVVWVQGGIDESLAEGLPYVDIYSVFDDPYRHDPRGALCSKARAVIAQNTFAFQRMAEIYPGKSHLLFPPVELGPATFDSAGELSLPAGFPEKIMGYVGSFHSDRFDTARFENFIDSFPDWGFLLVGRTDEEGERWVRRLKHQSRFLRLAPVPRQRLRPVWKSLDVSLLLYKDFPEQRGAFPTKVLESAYFGVPCVATECPMTADLEGIFPRASGADRLKDLAREAARMSETQVQEKYFYLASRMSPALHLVEVADWLSFSSKGPK